MDDASELRIVVGLGNPGIQYAFTPHNFGFLVVDELAERVGVRVDYDECQSLTARVTLAKQRVLLAKPQTMMNLSGIAVAQLLEKYERPLPAVMIIYDEVDLPVGTIRIRERGSAGTHNGMRSVVGTLGTQEIPRIRLGVAPDHPVGNLARYVLSPWKKAQLETIQETVVRAADAIETVFREGIAKAMSVYNAGLETQT
jgi:PTH1 family peptidyl-tRNA hydrolase